MTYEEARAQFPVRERLAYLNAGTNGPLARTTRVAAWATPAERSNPVTASLVKRIATSRAHLFEPMMQISEWNIVWPARRKRCKCL